MRGLVGEFVSRFLANGLSDALYAQEGDPNAQVGACLLLQNMVPDRHTRSVYAPRPAYTTGFDASTAPGLTITAPGKVTFATAPLSGAILTWTDANTPAVQSLGTGDGVTTVFAFIKGGNPYQPVNPKVFKNDWQGNQLQYNTSRTNLSTFSQDGTNWTAGAATITASQPTAPDGTSTLNKIKQDNTNALHQGSTIGTSATTPVGTYSARWVVSAGVASYAECVLADQTGGNALCIFSFLTNSLVANPYSRSSVGQGLWTNISTTSYALPNGCFAIEMTATKGDGTRPIAIRFRHNNGTTDLFTGDNATYFYGWGAMITQGSALGNYIPTTSVAVSVTDYQLTNTSVGTTIGNVSAIYTLGSRVYGMALGNNAGTYFDFPFCYDFATGAFVTISGITTGNVPNSTGYPNGASSGGVTAAAWVAPQMQLVGSKIIVTHYGFLGTGNFIGWIDVSNSSYPAWSAGNLSGGGGLSFTVPPVAVTQFNGRAYYAVGGSANSNNVIFSDSLNATVCTNATQVLTIGDNTPVLGFGQQPYESTTVGGIIQSILAFKANSIAQITGDPTTSNLAVSVIKTGAGTVAPATIASTPLGCMFMAGDGIRYVDLSGNVYNPIQSVRNPFANATLISASCFPSTACAAYNSNMYRISLYTTDLLGNIYRQEYVFDLEYGWSGPHVYDGSQTGIALISAYASSFLIVNRTLYPSTAGKNNTTVTPSSLDPGPFDTFVESGVTLAWSQTSCGLPDNAPMQMKSLKQATISYNPGNTTGDITVSALPTPIGTGQVSPPSQSSTLTFIPLGSLWGSVTWGAFTWGGSAQTQMTETTVPFADEITYKDLQFSVTGTAALNQRIGPISYRGTVSGYTNQDVP